MNSWYMPTDEPVLRNSDVAGLNRLMLRQAGVCAITISGPAGCGKTTLIEHTAQRLAGVLRVGAIIQGTAAKHDRERLAEVCSQVLLPECASPQAPADAACVQDALNRLNLGALDLLLIEAPAVASAEEAPDLGQTAYVALFSVAGGDDKVEKYAQIVRPAAMVVLTKSDLLGHVKFDVEAFETDVQGVHQNLTVLQVSPAMAIGMETWLNWLKERSAHCRTARRMEEHEVTSECFVG